MSYNSMSANQNFNALIQVGIEKAHVERSKVFWGLFDRLTGKGRIARRLGEG
ncbi:MAG: hypothetical protein OXR62_07765 [Ahrensia sp.]|nr:hypothetical protein [Ahrensia sp.]